MSNEATRHTATGVPPQIGRKAALLVEGIAVRVEILDVRGAGDGTDYLIRPIAGDGVQWVSAARVSVDEPTPTGPEPSLSEQGVNSIAAYFNATPDEVRRVATQSGLTVEG